MIYKLLLPEEWSELRAGSSFAGSATDLRDGFIHFSDAGQVRETASKHFAGIRELILLEVDPAKLPEPPVWEPSRGGRLFPHLYARLPLAAVVRDWVLPLEESGARRFPPELPSTF